MKLKLKKIKPFEIKNADNEVFTLLVDHSEFQYFKIIIGREIVEKRFDNFLLQKDNQTSVNINYEHNNNLKCKIVIGNLNKLSNIPFANKKQL